ncbi:ABC transporter ATP-binding protein [Couchioplanes azureus]|uniref:ABC transporter ATP-binding protein n=1 Tax=Couchioplanes caeruleus TaxID=56438 RepID=UPI00167017F0|nr:ABC transporter ATP-binding protein [Couchioplanes caeruleus]GGQ48431.1 ABC transporter ATP-binding protein [Couchioplanes caeruleus subsp. azureus]
MSVVEGDRLLVRSVRHGGPWAAGLAVAALTAAVADLLLPAALGAAVDAVLAPDARPGRWLAVAVGLVALIAAAEISTDLAAGMSGARATARLRHTLAGHVLALDPRAARRFPPGDLVSRLAGQVPEAGGAAAAVVLAGAAVVPPLGSLVALALIDPWLGATFVGGLAVLVALMRTYVTDAAEATTRYQRTQSDIAARLTEALAGARTIGAAGTVEREIARVLRPLPDLGRHGGRTWDMLGTAAARGAVVAPLAQLAVVAVAGLALTAGRLTPGALLAALQYATLGAGLGGVVGVLGRIARARAGSGRIAEVLAAPAHRHGDAGLPPGDGRLELRAVTVRHPAGGDRPVLDGIDLEVPGGATVAVVGRSGAGKSTLAAVAGRLLDPDEGDVRLDGVPLRRLRPEALRRAVGYAFARPVLVGDTVGAAIGLGPDRRTPELVRADARAARVDTVVERLPAGYDTPLREAPLSGGEAQRLGVARALRAERLLVLDDATSSLDTVTEHEVYQALLGTRDRRTRLVVTHRAGTAARADLVVWLDRGRVRACAPHDVLRPDPEYRALFPAAGR